MLQFSLPVGRWFGVPVRVHLSLVLLLALAEGYSAVATGGLIRGFGLWCALLAAVVVREGTRGVAAAYFDLPLRALFLLPIGGVMALSPRQGPLPQARTRVITLLGSLANFCVAVLLLVFSYGIDPHVHLLNQPWITIGHILRSTIWFQLLVGVVNLLPAASLSPRTSGLSASTGSSARATPGRALFGLWTAVLLAMFLAGLLTGLLWPVFLGLALLAYIYFRQDSGTTAAAATEGLSVSIREVMLTEYSPLSASSTLRDALQQTGHTAQELFPVLRGERLVGWISRGALASRLRTEGDSFLQGAISRSFQAVEPSEKIGEALRRATSLGSAEFIPVVENGAMVGLLTPGSLQRAIRELPLTRALAEAEGR